MQYDKYIYTNISNTVMPVQCYKQIEPYGNTKASIYLVSYLTGLYANIIWPIIGR